MGARQLYGDILVPTDGSDAATDAAEHAIRVARDSEATVHAVYVVDSRITMAADDDMRDDLAAQLRTTGQEAIDRILARAEEEGLEATGTVRRGTPSKEILAHAQEAEIDLIVIGTTGKTPREKRMGMGSVSEGVVEDATMPVLVVPGSAAE